jgi:sensor c-di-GMP phosphodiesterase-like protein
MAHILKLNIVAEGVETAEQRDFLHSNNCHFFQGYFYSAPLSKTQFADYYRDHT